MPGSCGHGCFRLFNYGQIKSGVAILNELTCANTSHKHHLHHLIRNIYIYIYIYVIIYVCVANLFHSVCICICICIYAWQQGSVGNAIFLSRVVHRSFPVVTSGHLPGGIIDHNDAMSAAVVASAHGMTDPIPHP